MKVFKSSLKNHLVLSWRDLSKLLGSKMSALKIQLGNLFKRKQVLPTIST